MFDVLKAWDYARTIFRSEKLRIAYIKAENLISRRSESQPAGAFWVDQIVFWVRPFGQIKLY